MKKTFVRKYASSQRIWKLEFDFRIKKNNSVKLKLK